MAWLVTTDNDQFSAKSLEDLKSKTEDNFNENELGNSNDIIPLNENEISANQKIITNKIEKQETKMKNIQSNKNNEILNNTKSKSNFI